MIDLNNFKILKNLSVKQNTQVYSVQNVETKEILAAKIFLTSNISKNKAINYEEIDAIMRIQHPTIVNIRGYSPSDFEGENNFTVLMDFISNGPLSNFHEKTIKNLTKTEYDTIIQKIFVGVARGMMILHHHNIIHKNLTKENVLIDEKNEPHILIFCSSSSQSNSKAPEVIEEQKRTEKSDVYSFGILMNEVLSEMNQNDTKILNENHPQFFNESIRKLIEECLFENPNERPTFEEIFNKLAFSNEQQKEKSFYLDNVDVNELLLYVNKINNKKSNKIKKEKSSENIEIEQVIYDPIVFPKMLCFDQTVKLTPNNLNISFFYCQLYRNSDERFELDEERFNKTLNDIFSCGDDLLIIRAVLLILVMKNIFDVTNVFKKILKEDLKHHRIFNDIFFNELKKNQILILNFVEVIKSIIKQKKVDLDTIYPIIKQVINADETSPTPVESNKLEFMDEDDFQEEEIYKNFPLILNFNIKYKNYCSYKPNLPTITIKVCREEVLKSVWSLDELNIFNFKIKTDFGEGENDEGGPTREFIELAFTNIVKPETGLFEIRNGNYWFKYTREVTEEMKKKFRSFGTLLGIAILNQLTIPIHFPRYFYKKLFNRKACIEDLNLYDPNLFNSLKYIQDHSCKKEDMLDFSYIDNEEGFEIDLTNFSYVEDSDNFQPESLTDENKNEFISRTIEWIFDRSIKDQFESFQEGFKRINVNKMIYKDFTLGEIDKLISGDKIKDWESLKLNAKYLDGFSENSIVIQWFWKYFDSLNEYKKLEALRFITGSSSVPPGGFKNVHIRFLRQNDDETLPIAHTCFSQIDLPEYKTYEDLAKSCSEAFPNMKFGFT